MTTRDERAHVLMVEDDELFRRSIVKVLAERYRVSQAGSVAEAEERLREIAPDVILLDMMLPGSPGMEFLRRLKGRQVRPPVIVLTALDRVQTVVEAMREGAVDYLTKPPRLEELDLAIQNALLTSAMASEVEQRRTLQLEDNRRQQILGRSPAIEAVRRSIEVAGPTDAVVLIQGETGTGKELVAQALHAASARASGPFVAVNCGAIPKDLFESEFFGHNKGAFTGADRRALGKAPPRASGDATSRRGRGAPSRRSSQAPAGDRGAGVLSGRRQRVGPGRYADRRLDPPGS